MAQSVQRLGQRLEGRVTGVRFILMFSKTSRPDVGPTQTAVQSVSVALCSGIERLEGKVEHLPQSSAEVRNAWR
jgi:hypothetical protein